MELKDPFLELSKLRERIGADDPNKSFGEPLDPLEEMFSKRKFLMLVVQLTKNIILLFMI